MPEMKQLRTWTLSRSYFASMTLPPWLKPGLLLLSVALMMLLVGCSNNSPARPALQVVPIPSEIKTVPFKWTVTDDGLFALKPDQY